MVSSPDAALCVVPVDCEQIVHPNSCADSFLRLFPSLNGVLQFLGGGRRHRRIATGCLWLQVGVSPFSPCQLLLRPSQVFIFERVHFNPAGSRREVADGHFQGIRSRSPKVLLHRGPTSTASALPRCCGCCRLEKNPPPFVGLASTSKLDAGCSFAGGPKDAEVGGSLEVVGGCGGRGANKQSLASALAPRPRRLGGRPPLGDMMRWSAVVEASSSSLQWRRRCLTRKAESTSATRVPTACSNNINDNNSKKTNIRSSKNIKKTAGER